VKRAAVKIASANHTAKLTFAPSAAPSRPRREDQFTPEAQSRSKRREGLSGDREAPKTVLSSSALAGAKLKFAHGRKAGGGASKAAPVGPLNLEGNQQ
jgi:hypothetical protein